jgi:two-component system sensor histidine kinase KdpD
MDRGPGFNESELDFVFDKFYRGKDAKTGGTGLGLSIVKGFVTAMGGKISVENRKNGGAIFTIKIPLNSSDLNHKKIEDL